jgi:hypothetical protein
VDVKVSDGKSAVVEDEGDLSDDDCDFFMADFAGGGGIALAPLRQRVLSRATASGAAVPSDQGRDDVDLMGRKCGVRDRCSPIAICSTVGIEEAGFSK